ASRPLNSSPYVRVFLRLDLPLSVSYVPAVRGFRLRLTALLLVIVILASCTHGGSPSSARSGGPAGGTLRLGMQNVPFYSMDPQREYAPNTWGLFRCCLLRTLMSYNGLGGPSSTQPQPDLAL